MFSYTKLTQHIHVCSTSADTRVDWQMFNVTPNDKQLVDLVLSFGEAFPRKDAEGNIIANTPAVPGQSVCTCFFRITLSFT